MVSAADIFIAVTRPLLSIVLPAGLCTGVRLLFGQLLSPLPRLVMESAILFAAYFTVLLFVAGQKELYLGLFRAFLARASVRETLMTAEGPGSSR